MSSQQGNQADATNWVIIKDEGLPGVQYVHGPFSSASECRTNEANVFASMTARRLPTAENNGQGVTHYNYFKSAMEKLLENPSSTQKMPVYLGDEDDWVHDELSIILKQGFQKEAAIALKKLAAGEDLGKYKSTKPPASDNALDLYSVSVRKISEFWLSATIKETEDKLDPGDRNKFSATKRYRIQKYLEQHLSIFYFEGGIEIFTDKTAAEEFAKRMGATGEPNVSMDLLGKSEYRAIYEVKTGDKKWPYKLVTINDAHINKENRVDWWEI